MISIQIRDFDNQRASSIVKSLETNIIVKDWDIIEDTLWIDGELRFVVDGQEEEDKTTTVLRNCINSSNGGRCACSIAIYDNFEVGC